MAIAAPPILNFGTRKQELGPGTGRDPEQELPVGPGTGATRTRNRSYLNRSYRRDPEQELPVEWP